MAFLTCKQFRTKANSFRSGWQGDLRNSAAKLLSHIPGWTAVHAEKLKETNFRTQDPLFNDLLDRHPSDPIESDYELIPKLLKGGNGTTLKETMLRDPLVEKVTFCFIPC